MDVFVLKNKSGYRFFQGRRLVPLQAEIEAINQQIEWHYRQISLLKNKRNSLPPISNLPNEILCQIFCVYATEFRELSNLQWTRLMLVCRRWHDLAIEEQYLWSFIEMYSNRDSHRLRIQLKRSGVAPLTIKFMYHTSPVSSLAVLVHSPRIVYLDITGHATVVLDLLAMLPHHQFPLLHTLKLKPDYKREEIPDGTLSTFADDIFDAAPRLRSLALSFIDLRWNLLRGLETLALTHCEDTASLTPSFGDLISTLGALPGLRDLRLDNVVSLKSPELVYNTVALPRLESLYLREALESTTDLLAHLTIPPTASMTVVSERAYNRSGCDTNSGIASTASSGPVRARCPVDAYRLPARGYSYRHYPQLHAQHIYSTTRSGRFRGRPVVRDQFASCE
ncbi:hypothetical protein DFH09DRAFT_388796 [Mycena vulgaris]|nr:hypothetical protein DFH09DRAFT_388796 [Mycena vulgaris]